MNDNIFFRILAFVIWIGLSFWVFNHINPWLGWILFLAGIYAMFNQFRKQSKITKIQ